MIDNLLLGFSVALHWDQLLFMLLGTLGGMWVGVIPGLGPITAMALLIPFTFTMDPLSALLMLASISAAANCSGSFTSILLNVPGESTAAATCFDGYPMSRQGRARVAIGLSIGASLFGALAGMLAVIALTQPLLALAKAFSPAEYFALAVLGLSVVAVLSREAPVQGIIMAALGLCLSFVGVDSVVGEVRFAFGVLELQSGIGLVPVTVGLFAVSEIIGWIVTRERVSQVGELTGSVMQGVVDTFRYPVALVRSTLLGIGIGITPGVGAVAASFLAYAVEKRASRTPERFGQGAPEGVIAPEAANNSAVCASLVPALTLGIPGGATSALLLVALTIHGLRPGTMLFTSQPDLIWGFFAGLMIGALMFAAMGLLMTNLFAKVTLVRAEILAPVFLVVSFAGVYAQEQRLFDVFLAVGFGIFGYLARRFGYPVVPLVIGLVLGTLAETSFHQGLTIAGGDVGSMLLRPGTAGLLGAALLLVAWTVWGALRDRRA
ncbi:tripartite tricarboxylate transporter permease [Falsiroseomonas selenitidurans]|uniref:Tripartite tricarboxylate transporter permease n=1 Tax=Falsiroseomonas selenitidurans TaxID=2716335 RepID=A0ABX1E2Q0_9PROT|nr:tripartite tricarboxylate transporter permease [Falsiroseomonas selenitidurans]NKC31459.1 tripartite tricarboxylate transporter permease [Falsiroseomonas selenitidurans]